MQNTTILTWLDEIYEYLELLGSDSNSPS